MAVDQRQGLPGDLADELLELVVGAGPFFDFRDQVHGHIDRSSFGLLFEGQVPAGGATARTPEGAERALQKRADLSDSPQGDLAAGGVPVVGHGMGIHIGSIKAY